MEKVTTYSHQSYSRDDRSLNVSSLIFDLPTLIENMKHSPAWIKGDLSAMILLKNKDKQMVLTVLHEGTEICSYQSDDSITFQIIEGKIRFHTRIESVDLEKDQQLTLHDHVKYSLSVKEETVLLLTILKGALSPAVN